MTQAAAAGVRSLADDLRGRSDGLLRELLVARPDLARPTPSDLTALAARSTTRASTQRAVDALDRAALDVLTVCAAVEEPLTTEVVRAGLGALPTDDSLIAAVLDRLWRLALLWGEGPRHVSRTVGEVLGPYPAGLGPTRAQLRLAPQPHLRLVAEPQGGMAARPGEGEDALPGAAAVVLDSLTWGPPVAVTDPGTRAREAAVWLAEQGLCALEGDVLTLPRETALERRGGRLLRSSQLRAPAPSMSTRDPAAVDRAAGGAASECLALLDEILASWSTAPPRVLKSGGLAVRDLNAAARALEMDPQRAAFLIEIAHGAGLLAEDDSAEAHWVPTADYDDWLDEPGGQRWARVVKAWWESTRDASLIGVHRDGKPIAALSAGVHRPWVRGLRQDVMGLLIDAEPGRALGQDALVELLTWHRPRRLPEDTVAVVRSVLEEAGALGLLGLGAAGSAARALSAEGEGELEAALARAIDTHLPAPVEHVLLQADLTAIVPGPMSGGLAHFLRLAADLESRGGASVHRFSEGSIRRALDAGWSVDDILTALADASSTQVPQPLDYLVRDAARRHGRVRVTSARGVLVVDDVGALDAILVDRALGALQLRRVAPTVAISAVATDLMIDLLQGAGHPAVIETSSGAIALREKRIRRSRSVATHRPTLQSVDDGTADEIIVEMRLGEATATRLRTDGGPPLLTTGDPTTSMVVLREASADRRPVWVGYSDGAGAVRRFLFYPESVEHGRVHGTAEGSRRTLSIHRITGVATD